MPHPSHILDLLIVGAQPDQPVDVDGVKVLFEGWKVDDLGRSEMLTALIDGGCARVWLDQPGRLLLYGNQSGGFRVQCPHCKDNLAPAFGRAHRAWKQGAERSLVCPGCDKSHALESVVLNPPGAFSSWAIVFSDVGAPTLQPHARRAITEAIGAHRTILRRP